MKLFVAGAGGAIGTPLVAQLAQQGHEVVAMTRSATKASRRSGARSPRSWSTS